MTRTFDLSRPDVEAIPSSFGGGWIVPLTADGRRALEEYFSEAPTRLRMAGDRDAYIVEPYQSSDLAEFLRTSGIAWKV